MSKYYANMYVNNGTRYQKDIEGTNKKKLASHISSVARANCFVGSEYNWKVWNEKGIIVTAGAGFKNRNGNFEYRSTKDLIGTLI